MDNPILIQISKALDYVETQKRILVAETRGMKDPAIPLYTLVARLQELRDLHARLKAITTGVSQLADHLSYELVPEAMRRTKQSTAILDGIGRVTLATRITASIADGQKTAALAYLREIGQGDLIIETVNAQTIGAYARTTLEAGDELPDQIFKTTLRTYTSITVPGAKKRRNGDDHALEDETGL